MNEIFTGDMGSMNMNFGLRFPCVQDSIKKGLMFLEGNLVSRDLRRFKDG
jgi:hypothetical protein